MRRAPLRTLAQRAQLSVRNGEAGSPSGHPATTPYAIAGWWCKYLLPLGGVLLDPFVGSGTTLAAGLDIGASKVIGIHKQAKYLKMAKKRVATS
jgi:DNA modification methylase